MKMALIQLYTFVFLIGAYSCASTEELAPPQNLHIYIPDNSGHLTIIARNALVEEKDSNPREKYFQIQFDSFRWGRRSFLGHTYHENDPEKSKLIFLLRDSIKIDSFSIQEIRSMEYKMQDSIKVFILDTSNK